MLIYHPVYDAHHSLFRMLFTLDLEYEIEIDKARILDFYLLFPALVKDIRLFPSLSRKKSEAKKFINIYHDPVAPKDMFRNMREIQLSALRCLVATEYLDKTRFEQGYLTKTSAELPEEIRTLLHQYRSEREPIASFILNDLAEIKLLGPDGLKDRTNLMEYRYDLA